MERPENSGEAGGLAGLRVLVVEDRGLIAGKIVRTLVAAKCIPLGPAATVQTGLDLLAAEGTGLGAAVLDIDLRGEPVYPLAEALRARGVPLLFVTGYAASAIPEAWKDVHRVDKPFRDITLLAGLEAALSGSSAVPGAGSTVPVDNTRSRAWDVVRQARNVIAEARILRDAADRD